MNCLEETKIRLKRRSAYCPILERVSKGIPVTFEENGIKKISLYIAARRMGMKISMRRLNSKNKKEITIERVK